MNECPHCGAELARRAKVCRECGSDASTGWKDSRGLDEAATELPEFDADDYDDFLAREGLGGRHRTRGGMPRWLLLLVVALLVAGFCLFLLR